MSTRSGPTRRRVTSTSVRKGSSASSTRTPQLSPSWPPTARPTPTTGGTPPTQPRAAGSLRGPS
eukprot:135669-Alexandrium_andersonii.AAC.1